MNCSVDFDSDCSEKDLSITPSRFHFRCALAVDLAVAVSIVVSIVAGDIAASKDIAPGMPLAPAYSADSPASLPRPAP